MRCCNHPRSTHYFDIDHNIRCMNVDSGVSSSGIIGLPYSIKCDCVNGVSKQFQAIKETEKREEAERQKWIDKLVERIKEMLVRRIYE